MDTLDDLLYKQEQMSKRFKSSLKEHVVDQIPPKQPVGLLKSEGTMTLFQFIQYVERLVNVTMKDLGVIFIPEENDTEIYIVEKNDTLWSISRKFNISVNELKELNNLTNNLLSIGQELKIKRTL